MLGHGRRVFIGMHIVPRFVKQDLIFQITSVSFFRGLFIIRRDYTIKGSHYEKYMVGIPGDQKSPKWRSTGKYLKSCILNIG